MVPAQTESLEGFYGQEEDRKTESKAQSQASPRTATTAPKQAYRCIAQTQKAHAEQEAAP